jgi:spartin
MQQGHRSTSSTTNTARSTTDRDNSKVELMQNFFDEAKRFVGKALKSDEKGDRMGALELYNKALNAIQSGLGAIKTSDHVTSSMKELKRKLDKLKDQVKNRMELLLDEEASSRNDSSQSSCHGNSKPLPATTKETVTAEADIIFSSSKGCRLIRVDDKGIVLSYISADSLNIFKYKNHIPGQPPAFLQCGDFVYPLIPGQSPVLRSSYKAYMFPDVESDNGNVGIFFNELPKEELKNLNHV